MVVVKRYYLNADIISQVDNFMLNNFYGVWSIDRENLSGVNVYTSKPDTVYWPKGSRQAKPIYDLMRFMFNVLLNSNYGNND